MLHTSAGCRLRKIIRTHRYCTIQSPAVNEDYVSVRINLMLQVLFSPVAHAHRRVPRGRGGDAPLVHPDFQRPLVRGVHPSFCNVESFAEHADRYGGQLSSEMIITVTDAVDAVSACWVVDVVFVHVIDVEDVFMVSVEVVRVGII